MSLTTSAILHATCSGRNGAGSISIPGLKVGDFVLGVYTGGSDSITTMEGVISVADQIQQTSGNNTTGFSFDIVLARLP